MAAEEALTFDMDGSPGSESERASRREWWLLGGGCLLIAAVLRFIRINYREYFGNEFRTLDLIAGQPTRKLFSGALDGALSIFNPLITLWGRLVGTEVEGLLRIPSAIFGLGTCVVFFLFARRYLRGTALAICVLVFAMNPILVATSNEATPYALLALFTVIAHFFAIRALDQGGGLNWTAYGLAVAGGIAAHPLYLFVPPAHFLFALLRGRRTPKAFVIVSIVGLALLSVLGVVAATYAGQQYPNKLDVQTPSSSDLVRALVGVTIGDFSRYGANDFVRGVMYFFVFACIVLSVQYYRKRTAEAMAMPENVVWIDETQDVVGTWRRLSLRAFLLFQWFTFVIPLTGLFLLGGFVPGFRLSPELFLILLPPLVVLVAMGIDAAPREGALAMGLLLLLCMVFYDVRVLSDRGFGIYDAFRTIEKKGYNPAQDLVVFTAPGDIKRSVARYGGGIKATPLASFDNKREFKERQQEIARLSADYQRVYVIYHDDYKTLGKTLHSPLRDWFGDDENGFTIEEKWVELSPDEQTELRLYKRSEPGQGEEAVTEPTS